MEKELFKLTNPQENIWNTEQYYNGTSVNNICGTVYIKTVIDFQKLVEAVNLTVKTNDNFNIHLIDINGTIYQKFETSCNYSAELIAITDKKELSSLEDTMCHQLFDIKENKLFEMKVFRFPNNYGGVVLSMHHLLGDSWTFGLVCKEIVSNYKKLLNSDSNFDATFSYTDYIKEDENYMSSEHFRKDEEFWNNAFKIIPEMATIPSLSKSTKNNITPVAGRKIVNLPYEMVKKINDFCKGNRISVYNFLMSIYSIYISRVTNLDDFVIGTPILNRTNFAEKHTNGMFISTVPFYIHMQNDASFINFSQSIATDSISMLRHQRYPYSNILENIRKRDSNTPNLYNIILSYQITKTLDDEIPCETHWVFNGNSADDLQIHIEDYNNTGSLDILYDYKKSKYTQKEISDLHNRIYHMIEQVLNNTNISVNDIEIVTEQEEHQLLYEFNDTHVDYPRDKTIIDLFEEQVEKTPDNIAVVFEDQKLTYKELNEKANQLAHHLIFNNVRSGDIVGIIVHRSMDMIVGIIGILKVGAAYLPLDPEYPFERLNYIIKDSNCNILLCNDGTISLLENLECIKLNIGNKNSIYDSPAVNNLDIHIDPTNLVYMIYTSGSTGNPKGVMINHKNLINFVVGEKLLINFSPEKTLVSVTTMCFDIFGLEIWCSLISGMKLILANDLEQNSQILLSKLCTRHDVNMIQTTPSRYLVLTSDIHNLEFFKNFTDIMIGGEACTQKLLKKLKHITNANIFNMYGPTETTIWSTFKDLTQSDSITVGTPIANTKCYILNSHKKLLPIGVPGELFIGGDGVSDGYWNRQDLTNEKFINSPFNNNEKIYDTNDLAYFNNNGEIIHLGRTDFQIKLHGYRIDLDEIKDRLLSISDIDDAIIVQKDNKFLICYYVSNHDYSASALSDYLLRFLPNYMIPAYFIRINSIPLTPNGKLNRFALPNIDLNEKKLEMPKTKTEKLICNTISSIINSKKVFTNVSFLDLGLDSLGIIQLQTNLLQYGYTLSTQDFYKYSTVQGLANMLDTNIVQHAEKIIKIPKQFCHTTENLKNTLANINYCENSLNNVLLTGANGFVGIHILHEIITTTNDIVYCLIRGKDYDESLNKLYDAYKFYFNDSFDILINKRIIVINGSISGPDCDINKSLKKYIDSFSTIIHAAAIVKHYGKFDDFNKINVLGTKNLLDFAYKHGKRFIYISSISVSGNYLVKQDNKSTIFDENSLYIGQHYNDNVYVHSKIEAERLVYSYMKKGLIAQVLRLGIISGRWSDGAFQKKINENAFYNRIKSILSLGAISSNMLQECIEFTPVDFCASAIVRLSKNSSCNNKIFNLYNNNLITLSDIVDVLTSFDIPIKILNNIDFDNYIKSATRDNKMAIKSIINDITYDSNNLLSLNYDFTVNIHSEYTQQYLSALGFMWPIVNKDYISKLLMYMKKVNFI